MSTATESSARTRVEQLERSEQKLRARQAELVALIDASPQAEAERTKAISTLILRMEKLPPQITERSEPRFARAACCANRIRRTR